ncbi:cyclic nucleotide-binding domain-containing protein 2-like isoform X2 [Ostrea edulis]|uniref:cyclic nucleotide-binding domain-containing protein 2-like isoform X2 n=1 Tax=Ostrea edulis TaxID=37623 RepID=UPI0024AEB475|nr:cyclic nucleotide-binding domain-containing protein 2-like isoform X2 [Ostrea edulis]
MSLLERMLSSPKDYPIPPLKIKEKINNYYRTYSLHGSGEPMAVTEPEEKHSAVKRRYRKHDYISSPKLQNPRLAPIRLLHVPVNLLWIYERAKEKRLVKEALRKRRFARKKEKSIEKIVVEVIEIPKLDPTPRNVVEPLVRFRRAVKTIQVLLKATLTNSQGQRHDLLSWAHEDTTSSKREYEMFGLTFDPGDFRAKKETILSNEAKAILSMEPERRTEEQLKVALLALNQGVEAFSEFPITMQKSLVRVGWYEHFEDKRVIIRQGHMADNFYFILSGTAVVTILQTDPDTGDEVVRTAAVLKKGNSFGELALMHGAKRSATVTCKNSVELLAVGREDFVDIFMPMDKDQEPEHIRFLRTIQLLKGWPIEKLPYHDPKICCFTYFRRGLLLCKDSNISDWVYVIKTGSCRVLKSLHSAKPNIPRLSSNQKLSKSFLRLPPISPPKSSKTCSSSSTSSSDKSPRSDCSCETSRTRKQKCTIQHLSDILHKPYPEDSTEQEEHERLLDHIFTQKHTYTSKWGKRTSPKVSQPESASKRHRPDTVYVQIQKLGPKETFGVEQVAFGQIGKTTSTILVSEGAECILINRKFFQQFLTDEEAKRIRRTLQPIPSEESLQRKLQDSTNWEAYKALTVVNHMVQQKTLHDAHFF